MQIYFWLLKCENNGNVFPFELCVFMQIATTEDDHHLEFVTWRVEVKSLAVADGSPRENASPFTLPSSLS